jgi:hypothetical protein
MKDCGLNGSATKDDIFFIIGCVRSATTAFAKILDTAGNANVFVEQPPKLLIESRELALGILDDPISVLRNTKHDPIQSVLRRGMKYGDKNAAYMPFIPYLNASWKCKIFLIVRDGRDVVRSLMDWHTFRHPIFFMEEDDPHSDIRLPEGVEWDYSRIRPNPSDPYHSRWKHFTIFQKAAWHWARYNEMALERLSMLENSGWMLVKMDEVDVDTIAEAFEFLELQGFDEELIDTLLHENINRLSIDLENEERFPAWPKWSKMQKRKFDELAGKMMFRLGYYESQFLK